MSIISLRTTLCPCGHRVEAPLPHQVECTLCILRMHRDSLRQASPFGLTKQLYGYANTNLTKITFEHIPKLTNLNLKRKANNKEKSLQYMQFRLMHNACNTQPCQVTSNSRDFAHILTAQHRQNLPAKSKNVLTLQDCTVGFCGPAEKLQNQHLIKSGRGCAWTA